MIITIPKHRLKRLRKKAKERSSRLERAQNLSQFLAQTCPRELFKYPLWQRLAKETKNDENILKNYPDTNENILLILLFATYIDDLPEKIIHLKTLKTVNNRSSSIRYDIKMIIKSLKRISSILSNESTSTNLELLICDSSYSSNHSHISTDDFIQDRLKHILTAFVENNSLHDPSFKNLEFMSEYTQMEFKYFFSNSPNAIQKCIFSIIRNLSIHFSNYYGLPAKMIEHERIANILTLQLFNFIGDDPEYLELDTVKKMRK